MNLVNFAVIRLSNYVYLHLLLLAVCRLVF